MLSYLSISNNTLVLKKYLNIKTLIIFWAIFHLGLIFIINLYETYSTYCEYNNKEINNNFTSITYALLGKPIPEIYSYYTGTNTCYGFFGINVRSNGILIGECDNKRVDVDFKSLESSVRFSTLISTLTYDLIKNEQPIDSLNLYFKKKVKLNDLVLKNIAVELFNKNDCNSSISISYYLIDFPKLKDYKRTKNDQYSLIKIKKMQFDLH